MGKSYIADKGPLVVLLSFTALAPRATTKHTSTQVESCNTRNHSCYLKKDSPNKQVYRRTNNHKSDRHYIMLLSPYRCHEVAKCES